MSKARQFLRFACVGAFGFLVDAAVLYGLLHRTGAGLYLGRLLSYLAAATSTWYLNRRFTFPGHESTNPLRQWASFLTVNTSGGLLNYAIYSAIVWQWPHYAWSPLAGVAAGSIGGLSINFTLSRRLIFRPSTPTAETRIRR